MYTVIHSYTISLLLGLTLSTTSFAVENTTLPKNTTTESTAIKQDNKEKPTINPWRIATKLAIGTAASFCINYILDYAATYAHELGHGITKRGKYTIEINQTGNPFAPWQGCCISDRPSSFLSILSGPLAGLCATYLQCIAIGTLDGYMQGKSLKESAKHGLRRPFSFLFKEIKETAKKYSSYLLNKQINEEINEPSLSSIIFHNLMLLRCGHMIGEFIYGFTPYDNGSNDGDGEKLWKRMFGNNCPTFSGNLTAFTLGFIGGKYIEGFIQAWRSTNKNTVSDSNKDV